MIIIFNTINLIRMRYFLIPIFFIIFSGNVLSQTSRLTITSGNSVYFPFNSLTKMNNGISYINWTRVTVFYSRLPGPGPVIWRLEVVPNSANFDGDAGNTLTLDHVEIEATDGGGNLSATNYFGPLGLDSPSPIIIVSGGPEGDATDNIIDLSYYCGTNARNRVVGSSPDYYYLDLILTLRPDN